MATGKNDVSRRRNYHGPSRKEHDRHHFEVKQRNGCHAPSSMCAVIDMPFEHQKAKKGSKLQGEKKRKISPVIWDSDVQAKKSPRYGGRDVKVLLEKRIIPASIISATIQSQSRSSSDVSDGCFSRSPASPKQGFGSKLLSLSPQEHMGESSVEDGELVQERNISKSRWAFDNETPRDMSLSEMDGIRDKKDGSGMSHEVGEFQIGQSDPWHGSTGGFGSELRAGSDCEEAIDNTGVLECQGNDVNEDNYLNKSGSQNDLESFEVKETMSFTQGRVSMLDSCRSVFEYERLNRISEGTYGIVFRAKDKKSGKVVAMKKVKMNKENSDLGFPLSALREINILLSMNHPSIVTVKEVVMGDLDNVFMVMEYMEHDLKALMEMRKRPFSTSEIKCLMLQLLDGVKYLHDNWVLHRDLKTSNLLMNNKGELKICDLGLSRHYGSPLKPYTPLVVTMWYRAPELLLGAEKYSTAIDMWSVGCILAELLANEPLFKGRNELNQLDKIFRMLGTPNEKIWPGFLELPGANANFVKQPHNLLRKKFPAASFTGSTVLSELGFDLLNRLLTYEPEKRITADEALNHTWFQEVPLPACKELMPTFPPRHAAGC